MPSLSKRGQAIIDDSPHSAYWDAHYERWEDPDYVGLCIAENKLVWDLLQPRLTAPRPNVPHSAVCYDDMLGSRLLRERLASFMGRTFLGREFAPEQIAVLAGAGSVLEILFHAITDAGDGVLVPTPSYAGFWSDLETRDELHIVPVHTDPEKGFTLTEELLDRALAESPHPITALLYTNPDNPTGAVADPAEMEMVVAWAERHDIHLVVDEIYALSVHGDAEFRSVASVVPGLGDSIHIVWAFSKDFGASGLRAGVLITENAAVMESMSMLAYWSAVSGDTQHLLSEMVDDTVWVDGFVAGMRDRLRDSYTAVTAVLDAHGIAHLPAAGGFFFLLDLREHLDEPTWDAEDRLWRRILERANVNLTPGSACRIGTPGFMRVCFATRPKDVVVGAIERVVQALG